MRLVRPIFALIIAVSVALLPTGGFAVPINGLAGQQTMAGPSAGEDGCCQDDINVKPCDQQKAQCPMAFCAAQSVSIGFASPFWLSPPVASGDRLPTPLDQVASLHRGSPPFKPPRI